MSVNKIVRECFINSLSGHHQVGVGGKSSQTQRMEARTQMSDCTHREQGSGVGRGPHMNSTQHTHVHTRISE